MNTTKQTNGESILRGADGHVQGRKLAAWICFFLGIALLVQGTFIPASEGIQAKVVPAVVAFCFSLLFWGLVTIQNVVQLVALLKGQNSATHTKEANDGQ
jgi:hypothetical protein